MSTVGKIPIEPSSTAIASELEQLLRIAESAADIKTKLEEQINKSSLILIIAVAGVAIFAPLVAIFTEFINEFPYEAKLLLASVGLIVFFGLPTLVFSTQFKYRAELKNKLAVEANNIERLVSMIDGQMDRANGKLNPIFRATAEMRIRRMTARRSDNFKNQTSESA
ncbi:MAG: hypothetical protein RL761_1567 [Pseudomonadota bacterium]|jgi:hypothetical protein